MNKEPDNKNDLSRQGKRALLEKLLREKAEKAGIQEGSESPLSYGQQRLWFIDQLSPGNSGYNAYRLIHLEGELDVEALEKSLNEIIRRHDICRTNFVQRDEEAIQLVHPHSPFKLQRIDLCSSTPQQQQEIFESTALQQTMGAFDLANDVLWRGALLQLSDHENILILVIHHIITDGWSWGVIHRELSTLYKAYMSNQDSPLASPPMQYAEFTRLQKQLVESVTGQQQLAYWRQKLDGAPPMLELPTVHQRPAVQGYRGEACVKVLPAELVKRVKQFGGEQGASFFMTMLTAFYMLLWRYSSQTDIVIGSPMAGRNSVEFEDMIGMFINILPIRTHVEGSLSFSDNLAVVRDNCLESYAHQDAPFDALVTELKPERALDHHPIFQVMFAVQQPLLQQLELKGLDCSPLSIGSRPLPYDLTLVVIEEYGEVSYQFDYSVDLFDSPTIERMAGHYLALLQAVLAEPDRPIGELSMLTQSEYQQIVVDWNQTQREYPNDRCVHQLVEAQVQSSPDAVAAVYDEQQLTYSELNERANQLAHHLRSLDVRRGVRVGLCLERSPEMVLAMLAILKAGGTYVPLDPDYPNDRLAFMLEDTHAPVAITHSILRGNLPETGAQIICVDTDWSLISEYDTNNPDNVSSPLDPAYVIYTSGSTGTPKGVVVPHSAINRLVCNSDYVELKASDRVVQASVCSFDAATFEIWGPLLNGAQLIGVSREISLNPLEFADFLRKQEISVLFITTALFNQMAREAGNVFSGLRYVLFGGQAVDPTWVHAVLRNGPPEHLLHVYGPTETTTFATWFPITSLEDDAVTVPIGYPIANSTAYVLDEQLNPVPVGVSGELYLGGDGVALDYLDRPKQTAKSFVADPFSKQQGARLYKTGDWVVYRDNGAIEFIGRRDLQVKIRGFRIELGEIEAALSRHETVQEAAVLAREDAPGDKRLIAYAVAANGNHGELSWDTLRTYLREHLPDYMIPSALVEMQAFPLTTNGKIDRKDFPAPTGQDRHKKVFVVPHNELEKKVAAIFRDILHVDDIGASDNFFDLGGHSLLLVQLHAKLQDEFNSDLSIVELFEYPTVEALAGRLSPSQSEQGIYQHIDESISRRAESSSSYEPIAIIGMAGRYPQSKNPQELWQHLVDGDEMVTILSDDELRAAGVSEEMLADPNYVKSSVVLEDIDQFDAAFFGYNPREAQIIDPQQRLFLECAWEALEDGGYTSSKYEKVIGVYAGVGQTRYHWGLMNDPELQEAVTEFQLQITNDKDFIPTRVSYKLNLKGPSVNVQTACSTSLVAIHMACRSLQQHECDMALAGGASVRFPQGTGYLYQPENIASPDGHCRAFDEKAQGCMRGNGASTVLLKRLDDALADGDSIVAVIKGSAINNDGAAKIGYTAPGIEGQTEVVYRAQAVAGVDPETISYIEAHGTGTPLGDPAEITGLTHAFRKKTQKKSFCAIGSIKTNIGHTDAAAGATGLIKTALALKNRMLPPSLYYEKPNPEIDFANSPFVVNAKLTPWQSENQQPLRAGVSSFGIGGTNAHAVLEQAPEQQASGPSRDWQLLLLSARTNNALETMGQNLVEKLETDAAIKLADLSYTLKVGRHDFDKRQAIICRNVEDARQVLLGKNPKQVFKGQPVAEKPLVTYMFTGQGSQYPNMARELYDSETVFREHVDVCCKTLKSSLGLDLRDVLYPQVERMDWAEQQLTQTRFTQPALFVTEYALAKLWMSWGIQPQSMIGHSIGEYVAAHLAGVFTLNDVLELVAERGRLMGEVETGSMLAVYLSAQELQPLLPDDISIAAINGPELCVASGPTAAIDVLEQDLLAKDLSPRRLHTSHAFHSAMMAPVVDRFVARVKQTKRMPPNLPYVSNVSGSWIIDEEAMDPLYWGKHLRYAVNFSAGLETLFDQADTVLLEVGPGRTLSTLARNHSARPEGLVILPSLQTAQDKQSDSAFILESLARLWLAGVNPDWKGFYKEQTRQRISLPTYPFERQRYWIGPETLVSNNTVAAAQKGVIRRLPLDDWFYLPSWKRSVLVPETHSNENRYKWLIFSDSSGLGEQLANRLDAMGYRVVTVTIADAYAERADGSYQIRSASQSDFSSLVEALLAADDVPDKVLHLWSLGENENDSLDEQSLQQRLSTGFYSVLFLIQAMGQKQITKPWELIVASSQSQQLVSDETLDPVRAMIAGAGKVGGLEYPNITSRCIDLKIKDAASEASSIQNTLLAEALGPSTDAVVAYRGRQRWTQVYEALQLKATENLPARFRHQGVYMIIGGLGGLGLTVAAYLAEKISARLVLVGRNVPPPRREWDVWLEEHGADNYISRRIEKIRALEEQGCEVVICAADVADTQAMTSAFAAAERQFGSINGVFHVAGAAKTGEIIQDITIDECRDQFRPKIQGLLVLDKLLAERKADFCLLFSSVSSVLGVTGFVSYTAAHLFMDAFANFKNQPGNTPWISIDWDNWNVAEDEDRNIVSGLSEFLMSAEEGGEAMSRILGIDALPHVVVSTGDLNARIARWSHDEIDEEVISHEESDTLEKPRLSLSSDYVAPRTDVEIKLAEIWQKLLGIGKVGIHDSFFELGGDSVINIQVVAKASQANIKLTPKQIFEYHTIAELADVASASDSATAKTADDIDDATGVVALTPIIGWFFEQEFAKPDHFNHAMLLNTSELLDAVALQKAVDAVVEHHDILRLRCLDNLPQGKFIIEEPGEQVRLDQVDLTGVAGTDKDRLLQDKAAEMLKGMDIVNGPVMQVASFKANTAADSRLLIIIHHLAVDIISWQLLVDDLEMAYLQAKRAEQIVLPIKTTAFRTWASRLNDYAQSSKVQQEWEYWKQLGKPPVSAIPVDSESGPNNIASMESVEVVLRKDLSDALLQDVHKTYNTQILDLIMVALNQAFAKWTGNRSLLISMEGLGREDIGDDTDLSRTAGWFTALYPLLLQLPAEDETAAAIKSIKEQLRELPGNGFSFGVLRYLSNNPEIVESLKSLPEPQVQFLYRGRTEQEFSNEIFGFTSETVGPLVDEENSRQHLLEINSYFANGLFTASWRYSRNFHSRSTIEALAQDFMESLTHLIDHCRTASNSSFTPSDFPNADIDQGALDKLMNKINLKD